MFALFSDSPSDIVEDPLGAKVKSDFGTRQEMFSVGNTQQHNIVQLATHKVS